MCVNCNIPAPVKHHVCELLGIKKNKYGLCSSAMCNLAFLCLDIKFNTSCYQNDLELHLKERGLFEGFKQAVMADGPSVSPADNSVYNFVLAKYFETDQRQVDEDFVRSLNVPLELLSKEPMHVHNMMYEIKYRQVKRIPRVLLENWNVEESVFLSNCAKYEFELLEEPFV